MLTDEQLVEAALDGSDNAFAEIVQRYQDRLLRFLLARSATRADADVELTGDDDPLAACIAHSEQENVWLAARRLLPDDAYDAMWLRYVEDLSVKEISTALDKSVSWTKVTLMRGRRRLSENFAAGSPAVIESESYG